MECASLKQPFEYDTKIKRGFLKRTFSTFLMVTNRYK